MKLTDLIPISNSYTDESVTTGNALLYFNKCVSILNTKLNINLPYLVTATDEFDALSESWLRRLFVPYLNYSVKLNDSSLTEASTYKIEFDEALREFGDKYMEVLDEQYILNEYNNVYRMDTSAATDNGWFFNRGSGSL